MIFLEIGSIPVAARSKAWLRLLSLAGIVVSNAAGGMDVYLFCVVRYRSLRRAEVIRQPLYQVKEKPIN